MREWTITGHEKDCLSTRNEARAERLAVKFCAINQVVGTAQTSSSSKAEEQGSHLYQSYGWLFSVFESIDTNADGFINKSEWMEAMATINASMPDGFEIDVEQTFDMLDDDKDGKVSMSEWEKLRYAFILSDKMLHF